MHRRNVLAFRALGLALVPGLSLLAYQLAAAQGSGGSWKIEYAATGTRKQNGNPSPPWGMPAGLPGYPWFTSASGNTAGISAPQLTTGTNTAETQGTVQVRLTWTGTGQPAVSWFAVDSKSSWDTANGSGTAADGYGDPQIATANHGESKGTRVYRVTGSSLTRSVPNASATVTLVTATGQQSASASCFVYAHPTDKNASLARVGGGDFNSLDDVYTANTLLSWDDSDGISPGPNPQSLTGTYGGTWSQTTPGQYGISTSVDDIEVRWQGADVPQTNKPTPTRPDVKVTTYKEVGNATMPLADASCTQKTVPWTYSVTDQKDGTVLKLVCNWICHYAYDNFRLDDTGTTVVGGKSGNIVELTDAHPSDTSTIPAGNYTFRTGFNIDSNSQEIPGFNVAIKHIGVKDLQDHANDNIPYSWAATPRLVSKAPSEPSPVYAYARLVLKQPSKYGKVDGWNQRGQKSPDVAIQYWTGNSYSYEYRTVETDGGAGV